ncbi:sensor histidine kinase [Actinocorallia populi]|uniref:sensor histidine kinase n=1 Tax=Actinocorallia populi TaxID=2079200 RepID=UPI000D08C01E|nr:sensor histidine kinase [Actinocorallia populi]
MPAVRNDQRSLVHRHFSYREEAEFLTAGGAFFGSAGHGTRLVAVASPRRLDALREVVTGELECHRADDWFGTPPRALAALMTEGRERWWRDGTASILVEQRWVGRSRRELREWKRYEALLNVVLAGTPTRMLCAFDAERVPADVLRAAPRTHQGEDYTDPAAFVAECDASPLPVPRDPVAVRHFRRGDLTSLRAFADQHARALGLRRTMPMLLSVNEVATNILKHGGGEGVLCVWSDGASVVCDLIDPAFVLADPFLGFIPPRADRTGEAGMWAVRQLCDLVEIRSGRDGTVFRLHVHLA